MKQVLVIVNNRDGKNDYIYISFGIYLFYHPTPRSRPHIWDSGEPAYQ